MFLSESYVPTALQMAQSTLKFGDSQQPNRSAYSLTLAAGIPFHAVRGDRPKLSRQWHAYLRHAGGLHAAAEDAPDILAQLNWAEVATAGACIVEVFLKTPETPSTTHTVTCHICVCSGVAAVGLFKVANKAEGRRAVAVRLDGPTTC